MLKKVNIALVYCELCDSLIWSKTVHDFKYCKCEKSFIDGGRDYCRVGGNPAHTFTFFIEISINSDAVHTTKDYFEYIEAKIALWKEHKFEDALAKERIDRINEQEVSRSWLERITKWIRKKIFQK